MTEFLPRLDILPAAQRVFWDELTELPDGFTLYGGTAIALHLGHRVSVDFDFFGTQAFAPLDLAALLPCLKGATITQTAPNTLGAVVDRGGPVQISFFGVPRLGRISTPHISPGNGLPVAALIDLAGTKAATVQQRAEAKDYVDIDAMLTSGAATLADAIGAAQSIYGASYIPELTLKALTWFDDLGLRTLPNDVKSRLVTAVRGVDLDRLPRFQLMQGGSAS